MILEIYFKTLYLNILMSMQLTTFNKTAMGVTLSVNAEISPWLVEKVLPKHSVVTFSLKKSESQ